MAVCDLPEAPRILDVGCGPGRQTLQLAALTPGRICALDLEARSLEALARNVRAGDLVNRITPIRGSMTQLCFADECFDLIWSEGAIYCMGFEAGLEAWKRFLRPGGYVAVTELTWLTNRPPEPARGFWKEHYSAMATTEANLAAIDRAGYERIEAFPLPESDWWNHFYAGLATEIEAVEHEFANLELGAGREVVDLMNREMEVLRESPGAYSYVFYIARKPK
jgi:ubiquinone/menaquinone biosynthesis C-methylase UbiE